MNTLVTTGGKVALIGGGAVGALLLLPKLFTQAVGNTVFSWLPPDQRPLATGACSSSCCCCFCLILMAVLISYTK